MLKKFICISLSFALAASLSACNQESKSLEGSSNKEKIITLSTLRSDRFLESAIQKYKEKHPEITIQVKEYAAAPEAVKAAPDEGKGKKTQMILMGEDNPEDVEKYVSTLNTEIMTGKGPDIVSVDKLPYKKYADKGLLVNISEMIKSDSSFDINKYYTNILNSLKYNNNLYAFPLRFSFEMLNGNKSMLDKSETAFDDSKWTWQDFKSITAKLLNSPNSDSGVLALANVGELELLRNFIGSNYDKFVDMEKKTADFNNKEFIDILNLCKEMYDKKLVDTSVKEDMIARGNSLFMKQNLKMYVDYLMMSKSAFNGNGKLYRLPDDGDSEGISFNTDALYAISNSSQYKAEAWDFIKFMLSDEMQSTMELAGFSVNKEATEANVKRALEMSKSGKMKLMGPGGEIKPKPASEEDIQILKKLIGEINRYDGADREILKIILEESKSFFKGQKSEEEVAGLIQDRVNTYLNE